LIGILAVSFFIQYGFESSFRSYLDHNREKKIDRVVTEIEKTYKKEGHFSSDQVNELLHEYAMTDQLYFQLYDNMNHLQVDSSRIRGMMNSLGLTEPVQNGEEWNSKSYTLMVNKKVIGKLTSIYPVGLIDDEYTFIQTIQLYIYAAVILTIVLAVIFSMIFSKKLTSSEEAFFCDKRIETA
jgi:hypothetical protein